MNSIDEGITISSNPVSLNAYFSNRDNFESDSNVSDVSDPHLRKQPSPMNSTDRGITILSNPVSLDASFSSRDNL
jgi:hypothetical protein